LRFPLRDSPVFLGENLTGRMIMSRNRWWDGTGWPERPFATKKKKNKKSTRLRKEKWHHDPKCHYCKRELEWEETTLDHVIPQSKGGETSEENTVLACERCNKEKGDKVYSPSPKTCIEDVT
jgi:5-methylcytosine-specific restriction protein A